MSPEGIDPQEAVYGDVYKPKRKKDHPTPQPSGTSKHYIVIGEIDPVTKVPDWEIEHPAECENTLSHAYGDEINEFIYTCVVGSIIAEDGIDAFGWMRMGSKWPDLMPTVPGKYEIEPWNEKYWTDYGWEYDGGLRLVGEIA